MKVGKGGRGRNEERLRLHLGLGWAGQRPQDSCYVEGGVGSMLEEALNPGDHRRWWQGHWTAHAQGGSFPATLGERGPDPQMLGLHAPAIGSWTRVTTAQVPTADPAADAGAPRSTSMDSAVGPPVSFAPSVTTQNMLALVCQGAMAPQASARCCPCSSSLHLRVGHSSMLPPAPVLLGTLRGASPPGGPSSSSRDRCICALTAEVECSTLAL